MTSDEYLGLFTAKSFFSEYIYCGTKGGHGILEELEGDSRWSEWQYDPYNEKPPKKKLEIKLPVEFLF